MAHEVTHGLIRHRLGWRRGIGLPSWIAEGYCDFVAQESSFPDADGKCLLANGLSNPSKSFQYFECREMMRYLIKQQHLDFIQVVQRANDFAAVEAAPRSALSPPEPTP